MNNHEYHNVTIDSTELAQMRIEIKTLQHNLNQQKIFSDRLMRRVMARRVSWIDRLVKLEIFLVLPLAFLSFLFIKCFMGLSWLFIIVTMIFMTADVILDIFINRLPPDAFSSLSLLELKEKLIKRKRMRRLQTIIGLPLTVVWAIWFAFDLISNSIGIFEDIPPFVTVSLISFLLVIGIIIAVLLYRKMQATDTTALAEIEELHESDV